MQGNRSRDTKPEIRLRSELHKRGLRYRVSARPLPNIRRTADIVFFRQRVAVFVDGCYWHGCPDHYRLPTTNREYWEEKIARNRARDAEIDAALRQAGWTIIRAWEHEDSTAVADKVELAVRGQASNG